MILNEIKKELRHSKNLTLTSRYIILYNGSSVVIYDYEFVCQKKILNLKYVYNGYVSPDETKLLLVSNKNRYYLVSLENFSVLKTCSIKSPHNGNLEGNACWNSNDSFFLPVQNDISMLSTFRKYNCDSSDSFEDFLAELFWIKYVTFVAKNDSYLIIGLNRNDDVWNVVWMDKCGNYTSYEIDSFNEAILDVCVCCDDEKIIGMARIVGDGSYYTVYDVVVRKTYQGKGVGKILMNEIVNWYKSIEDDDTYLYLGASFGKEGFYEKFGFKTRPYGHIGAGMKYEVDD